MAAEGSDNDADALEAWVAVLGELTAGRKSWRKPEPLTKPPTASIGG